MSAATGGRPAGQASWAEGCSHLPGGNSHGVTDRFASCREVGVVRGRNARAVRAVRTASRRTAHGHLETERDSERGWFLRDTITHLRRQIKAFDGGKQPASVDYDRDRDTRTASAQPASAQPASADFDRDSLREPSSIEDRRNDDPVDLRGFKTFGRESGAVAAELRSRALAAVEHMQGCSDEIRSAATHAIEKFDSKDAKLARHALLTSKPSYLRAWSKIMTNKEIARHRTAVGGGPRGASVPRPHHRGYPVRVPDTCTARPVADLTSPFLMSDLRSAARVVVATGETYHVPQAQNVQYNFQSEGAEAADAAPPFGQSTIRNWMARAFLPLSIEAMNDFQNLEEGIARLLAAGQSDCEARAFVQGSGIEEPMGLVSSLAATANSVVNTATSGVFSLGDLYTLQASLSAHYRLTSSWLGNDLIYNKIREFAGGGSSSSFWSNITQDRPPILFGRNALEAEAMNPVVASGNKILVFGDLQSYTICDRWGTVVELIPWLPGAHNRPSGQRGFFSTFRVGGDVTNPTGLRLLNVT